MSVGTQPAGPLSIHRGKEHHRNDYPLQARQIYLTLAPQSRRGLGGGGAGGGGGGGVGRLGIGNSNLRYI